MSSSSTKTLTKTGRPPSGEVSCSPSLGKRAATSANTSATVAPDASMVRLPAAWLRRMVGRLMVAVMGVSFRCS